MNLLQLSMVVVLCVGMSLFAFVLAALFVRAWAAAFWAAAERAEREAWAALRECVADERGTAEGIEPPPFIPNR